GWTRCTEGPTMPRWVFLLGVGLALVAGAFVAVEAALGPHAGITERNCQRIRPEMGYPEVERIFGRPPDRCWGLMPSNPDGVAWWSDAEGAAVVYFDWEGRVVSAAFRCTRPPLLRRLRDWLG